MGNTNYLKNEELPEKEFVVINPEGRVIGTFPKEEALELAYNEDLDLVLVSPNAEPPVCKIIDFGKFNYEMTKKAKEKKKNQKEFDTKEIRLTPNIDTNDFNIKVKAVKKFLENNNHVKLTMKFKGREFAFLDQGVELFKRFIQECGVTKDIDKSIVTENKTLTVTL